MKANILQIAFLYLTIVLMTGCQSLDDDSAYAIETRASFFLVNGASGGYGLVKLADGVMHEGWNQTAGIGDADLSDVKMVENRLWISSGPRKAIFQVHPTSGKTERTISELPVAPHFMAVGVKQILVADTAAGKIIFIKRRNGSVTHATFSGKPGQCLYNSGRFYLQVDGSKLAVYDESALTTRATIEIGAPIEEVLLDKYHNIQVVSVDTGGRYQAVVSANADYLVGEKYLVSYSKLRPSPYFAARFGSEYLKDLLLRGWAIQSNTGETLVDSAQGFEADFFEGRLFYSFHDSLHAISLSPTGQKFSYPMASPPLRSFFQYGNN